jgi:hypothetical protein
MRHRRTLSILSLGVAALCAAAPAAPAETIHEIRGTRHADVLRGTTGPDRIFGRGGNDRLSGRGGIDTLYGGPGNDRLDGGPGVDLLYCGSGFDRATAVRGQDVVRGCERVTWHTAASTPGTTPGTTPGPGTGQAPVVPSRTYTGTMAVTEHILSYCSLSNTPVDTGTRQTTMPAIVTTGPPKVPQAASPFLFLPPPVGLETNPINLLVTEPDAYLNAEGALFLGSAETFAGTSPSLILQYWDLRLSGTALTGTLTQDHKEEAAALNLLSTELELVPCRPSLGEIGFVLPVAEGATLTGTLTEHQATLHVEGHTYDGSRTFVADVTASR